jgi:hypothetical protein
MFSVHRQSTQVRLANEVNGDELGKYDRVLIVAYHSAYAYRRVFRKVHLVLDAQHCHFGELKP